MICNNCKGSCAQTLPGQKQCIKCLRLAVTDTTMVRMDRFTAGVLWGVGLSALFVVLYQLVVQG